MQSRRPVLAAVEQLDADAPPALVLERVAHAYGAAPSVRGIDLSVGQGEIVCLLGPSGCGKTTVLRLAAGLETPTEGRIALAGRLVAQAGRAVPPEDRRVGLVFQDIALFPHLDLLDNIAFGLRGGSAEKRAIAAEWVARVGLQHRRDAWPHMLSGGEQQRVALARALAPGPRLLLMDEPFSSLDPHLRYRLRSSTLELLRQAGVPALIVTHDAEEAMALADRVAVMRQGALVQMGSPAEIYERPADLFAARLFGPVNEWRGIVQAGRLATPLGPLAANLPDGQQAVAVVRAEDVVPAGAGDGIAAQAGPVRWLGADALVELELAAPAGGPASRILVRCRRGQAPLPGERLAVRVAPQAAHVFADPGEGA